MAKTRSPNYPAIDLATAIGLAEKLYAKAQRHPVPIESVTKDIWEMTPGSSYVAQCVAALRAFGLVGIEGTGDKRKLRVSDDAAKIIEGTADRGALLKKAALAPKVHQAVWSQYQADGLPPDSTIQHYLLFDYPQPFNKGKVGRFIKQLRSTLEYAEIKKGEGIEGSAETEENDGDRAGDIDGERTGDNTNGSSGPAEEDIGPPVLPPASPGVKQDVFTLDEGEVVLRWPAVLSEESFEDFESWLDLMKRKIRRTVDTAE